MPPKKGTGGNEKVIELIELIEPLWEQQPGEPIEWFKRFCRVRNQIGTRNFLAAYRAECEEKGRKGKLPRSHPGTWSRARIRFRWDERFQAWDLHKQEMEDQVWDERWNKWRDKGWEYFELLMEKAEPMLRMPFVEQSITQNQGGKVTLTTITATEWRQFLVPMKMIKDAMEIGAMVIGDANAAVNLITQKGFKVVDPTVASDPSVYLEGAGIDELNSMGLALENPTALPDFANLPDLKSAEPSDSQPPKPEEGGDPEI